MDQVFICKGGPERVLKGHKVDLGNRRVYLKTQTRMKDIFREHSQGRGTQPSVGKRRHINCGGGHHGPKHSSSPCRRKCYAAQIWLDRLGIYVGTSIQFAATLGRLDSECVAGAVAFVTTAVLTEVYLVPAGSAITLKLLLGLSNGSWPRKSSHAAFSPVISVHLSIALRCSGQARTVMPYFRTDNGRSIDFL